MFVSFFHILLEGCVLLGYPTFIGYSRGSYAMLYYIDLDDTVFDTKHRTHHLQNPNTNAAWEMFYADMYLDPLMPGAAQLDLLLNNGEDVKFLSARPERFRQHTVNSLSRVYRHYDVQSHPVILKPDGVYSPASAWKVSELQLRHTPQDRFVFVDDNKLNRQAVQQAFPEATVMAPQDMWEMVRTMLPDIAPIEVPSEDVENEVYGDDDLIL